MAEKEVSFERPYYSVELERGQRGHYGWKIKASGPDLKLLKKELKETNDWVIELEKVLREDVWKIKEKK